MRPSFYWFQCCWRWDGVLVLVLVLVRVLVRVLTGTGTGTDTKCWLRCGRPLALTGAALGGRQGKVAAG